MIETTQAHLLLTDAQNSVRLRHHLVPQIDIVDEFDESEREHGRACLVAGEKERFELVAELCLQARRPGLSGLHLAMQH